MVFTYICHGEIPLMLIQKNATGRCLGHRFQDRVATLMWNTGAASVALGDRDSP